MESTEFKIPCSKHEGYTVTHGCTYIECKYDILFCSACFLDKLEHAHEHRRYVFPIQKFANEFFRNVHLVKDKMKPYDEVLNSKQDHLNFYSRYMMEQKDHVENELYGIVEQLQFFIEKIKVSAFSEVEAHEKHLHMQYNQLEECYKSPEIGFINMTSPQEMISKLQNVPTEQVESYLNKFREILYALKDPSVSQFFTTISGVCNNIQTYRKKHINPIALSSIIQKHFKALFADIDQNVQNFVREVVKSHSEREYRMPMQSSGHQKESQLNFEPITTNSKGRSLSPIGRQYYPKSNDVVASTPKNLFEDSNRKIAFKEILNYSQRELSIKTRNPFSFNGLSFTIDKKLELEEKTSALAVCSLPDNYFVLSTKDNLLRIVKNTSNGFSVIAHFGLKNDQSSFWSVARIFPSNSGGNYFAAGNESGNIYIWRSDQIIEGSSDCRPLAALIPDNEADEITTIQDLNTGVHLAAGDSQGNIVIWDYLSGTHLQNLSLHSSQITSMTLFANNSLAVGSYDGGLSFWEIKVKGTNTLEMVPIKNTKGTYYVYCVFSSKENPNVIYYSDSSKKVKMVDLFASNLRETEKSIGADPVLEILSCSVNSNFLLFLFSKSSVSICNGHNLELLHTVENPDLLSNNLTLTLSSCYKTVFLDGNNTSEANFAIIDQSNKSNKVLSLFKINF